MKKTCKNCNVEYDLSFYHKSKRHADGHLKECKTCRNHKKRIQYNEKPNLEKRKELYHKTKDAKRKYIRDKSNKYYSKNKQQVIKRALKYREKLPKAYLSMLIKRSLNIEPTTDLIEIKKMQIKILRTRPL